MRATFFKTIEEVYLQRDDIFVLTADLGYKLFDSLKEQCADRFYDIGIAESNMIGVASGLALSGKTVYCYSMVPFLVMRAYEQVRVDVAYHNLNVRLVAVGGGLTYGLEGFTHFGLEDFALMRAMPNMTIVIPADPIEAQCLARLSRTHEGPMYIRLGRSGEPAVHDKAPRFRIGEPIFLQEGKHIALCAVGTMVHTGAQVAGMLQQKGIKASLINMHTLKPLNREIIRQIAAAHEVIFSMEEHFIEGGLGSAIAEVLAESGYSGTFRRVGIGELGRHTGSCDYLKDKYGLTAARVFERVITEIK